MTEIEQTDETNETPRTVRTSCLPPAERREMRRLWRSIGADEARRRAAPLRQAVAHFAERLADGQLDDDEERASALLEAADALSRADAFEALAAELERHEGERR